MDTTNTSADVSADTTIVDAVLATLTALVRGCNTDVIAQLGAEAIDLTRSQLAELLDGISSAADALKCLGDATHEAVEDMVRDDEESFEAGTCALDEASGCFNRLADDVRPRA